MPVCTAALLRPQEILGREGTGGSVSCFTKIPSPGWSVKALSGLVPAVAEGPSKVPLVLVPGHAGRAPQGTWCVTLCLPASLNWAFQLLMLCRELST